MKSLNTLANKVLDAYPVTRDYLKKVIAVEALHTNTNLAITRLLEIIESQQAQLDIGSRTRKFRTCWVDVLCNLAYETVDRFNNHLPFCDVPRNRFLTEVNKNDFSLMKHWGLIRQRPNHKWAITRMGIGFLLQIPGFRFIDDSILQVGGVKDNYRHNPKSKPIKLDDLISEPIQIPLSYRETLLNIFNEMEP